MLRAFFELNRRVFEKLYPHFPQMTFSIWEHYVDEIVRMLDARPGQTVVEIGAGKTCPYAGRLERRTDTTLIGVDLAADDMHENPDLDERIVADVTEGIPLADASADLVVSRCVLEHLRDVEAFFAEMRRVLKPGGRFLHLFACRFSPSGVLNRLAGEPTTHALLAVFRPEQVEPGGFPAFYDRCYPSAMRAMLRRQRLTLTDVRCGYFQSEYYAFCLPLALLSAVYEWTVMTLGIESLAANVLIAGEKPAHTSRT
ncbi:MAG TPA: class I SAM-dependent methyltransferase [Planctomycetota bacterium]|nr:class I SAM-dependent methyltransferase [Planctomycetota bacterium]